MLKNLILLAAVSTLAACASNRCKTDEPHHRAVAYPYLQDAPSVSAPEPSDEFAIPEVAQVEASEPADGEAGQLGCLDVPPPLPALEERSVEPAPVQG